MKENNRYTVLTILATILMMVFTFNSPYFFGTNPVWNILLTPVWIFSCFLTGGIVIVIPFLLIEYILKILEEKCENFSQKRLRIILVIAAVVICIAFGLGFTIINKK